MHLIKNYPLILGTLALSQWGRKNQKAVEWESLAQQSKEEILTLASRCYEHPTIELGQEDLTPEGLALFHEVLELLRETRIPNIEIIARALAQSYLQDMEEQLLLHPPFF